jgi:hypothetical protein
VGRTSRCLPGEPDLPAVLKAIWHEAHAYRAAIHRSLATVHCDLRISILDSIPDHGQDWPGTIRLDGECACRDFLVDMIVEGHRLLAERAGQLRNPLGAVRIHVRTRAAGDWVRRRRTEMGAQARIDRIRPGARARGLPDEFHRALLEYLVDEAGSMTPLESHDELVHRLTVRCAAEFGGPPQQYLTRVIDGVAVIERHCRRGPRVNAGTAAQPEHVTWWERYIERPLGRRPRRTDQAISAMPDGYGFGTDLRCPHAEEDFEQVINDFVKIDTTAVAILVAAFARQPDSPATALRAGISELVAQDLLPERSAAELLSDRARFVEAMRRLSALG